MSDRDRNYSLYRVLTISREELLGIFLLFEMRFILGIGSIFVIDTCLLFKKAVFTFIHFKRFSSSLKRLKFFLNSLQKREM